MVKPIQQHRIASQNKAPSIILTQDDRLSIVEEADMLFREAFTEADGAYAPLERTVCVMDAARRRGVNLALQAGAFAALRVRGQLPEEDSESKTVEIEASTHFIQIWKPDDEADQKALAAGDTPNGLHVWAGDILRGEIVDLSTPQLPKLALIQSGEPWTAREPPRFIWNRQRASINKGFLHSTDVKAVELIKPLASKILQRVFDVRARAFYAMAAARQKAVEAASAEGSKIQHEEK